MATEMVTDFPVRDPATGAEVARLPLVDAAGVQAAIRAARAAQGPWAQLPVRARARALGAFRRAVAAQADAVATAISQEVGKPAVEALLQEVVPLLEMMDRFAARAPRVLGPQRVPVRFFPHRRSERRWSPKGVVGVIGPWNYPVSISVGDAFAALVAGNAVVVKPSELASACVVLAKRLWDGSGLPADLFQVVTGYADTARAVVEGVDHVVFTGSVETGRKVAEACARRLIGCTLELGGKAPAVVCADADLDRTAAALVWGAFANAGQACVSVERAFVVREVYEPLLAKVQVLATAVRLGDPGAAGTDVGAMPDPRQVDRVEAQVQDAVARGARLLVGGRRLDLPAQGYVPTVLADCTPEMAVLSEETFGPVLPLMPVASEGEAIALANASELGLAAYVFTRDRRKGSRLADRLEAGAVMVNDVMACFAQVEAPWGGVKRSGLGRVHGDEGLRELSSLKHVNLPRTPWLRREPWWFPYGEPIRTAFLRIVRLLYAR